MAKKKGQEGEGKAKAKKAQAGEEAGAQGRGQEGQRQRPAQGLDQALGQGRQGARRRQDPRLHARPVGPDLHAAAGLVRRRRDQGRAAGHRRHHARPAAGRAGRRQPLFHHAQPQQALDHARFQEQGGHEGARAPGEDLRRAGRELRARRARPHGAHLGAHPCAQPAHDRGLGQGLRPRPLRGLQGLRERGAVRRRLGLDHRLPRRPAAGDRRADRRFRHRPAPGARHRQRALPAQAHGPRPARADARCRTACSISAASSCATSSASRTGR